MTANISQLVWARNFRPEVSTDCFRTTKSPCRLSALLKAISLGTVERLVKAAHGLGKPDE